MAQTINLNAEQSGNMISDDAEPALTLSNSSTGPGLQAYGMVVTSTASIDSMDITRLTGSPTIEGGVSIVSTVAGTVPATLERTIAGNYSTSTLILGGSSVASGAVIELQGSAYTSVMSIDFAAGTDWGAIGGIRVKASDGDTMFWIPLLPEGSIEAAAAFKS